MHRAVGHAVLLVTDSVRRTGVTRGAGYDQGMISVVIPTFRRHSSLARTLRAIALQTLPPREVIVVTGDADSDAIIAVALEAGQRVTVLESVPGVCVQRNLGIGYARSRYIWLCDDDIEAPANYLEHIAQFLATNPADGAVTGMIFEPDVQGEWQSQYRLKGERSLVVHWVFQLSIWGELPPAERLGPIGRYACARLQSAGNGLSAAGWPRNVSFAGPVMRAAVYGLGAAVVRRDWLLASPYDPELDTRGIGDNYGVAMGMPGALPPQPDWNNPRARSGAVASAPLRGRPPIAVLTNLAVKHHKSPEGRWDELDAHRLRTLALARFLRARQDYSWRLGTWLVWSIIGLASAALMRGRFGRALLNLRLAGSIVWLLSART